MTIRNRMRFALCACLLAASAGADITQKGWGVVDQQEQVAPGVWRVRCGTPEEFTPVKFREKPPAVDAMAKLPPSGEPLFSTADVAFHSGARGCSVRIPLQPHEKIYGYGLQLKSLAQNGTRKVCRVSDNQDADLGDSHAPVPFYVSTLGYGVLVDSARYVAFYCANLDALASAPKPPTANADSTVATSTQELYKPREVARTCMTVDVPVAQGVDLYIFGGPAMADAVRRYVLFSGGGCVPPLWGLGMWYRGFGQYVADDVLKLAKEFRDQHMPCDVFGLEPGWHTHAYSCTYAWSKGWPDPDAFIASMKGMHFKLNLWEHAFVHPTSPIHEAMKPYAGDYRVWEGLVPDFATEGARKVFADYHEQNLVKKGIEGFKLDECDNQPISKTPWSFPELASFPSGMDGEQMHSLFGLLYQKTLNAIFTKNNQRTWSKVRASHAMASPLPFVIYSDHYDHRDYVRGLATSGFSGLLWQPEVREAASLEDLYRRLHTAVLSPQAVVDAWFLKNPPWKQIDREKNNNNELLANWEEVQAVCKKICEFRMSLIPYLYSAFNDYATGGMPPFRAVVMDYPEDANTFAIDDQYMIGESLMAAPLFAGQTKRTVYLPEGTWHDFWSHAKHKGEQKIEVEAPFDQIPLFVKDGSLVPMAAPVEYILPDTCFDITVNAFGDQCRPFRLYEDDGLTFNFEKGERNILELQWKTGGGKVTKSGAYNGPARYKIVGWK